MSSSPTPGAVAEASEPSSAAAASPSPLLTFSICNAHQPHLPFTCSLPADTRISSLKRHLQLHYPLSPAPSLQRLVCEGRLLGDDERLGPLLHHLPPPQRKMHLAIRGHSSSTAASAVLTSPEEGKAGTDERPQTHAEAACIQSPPLDSPPTLTQMPSATHSPLPHPQPQGGMHGGGEGHMQSGAGTAAAASASAAGAVASYPFSAPPAYPHPMAQGYYPAYCPPLLAYGGPSLSHSGFGLRQRSGVSGAGVSASSSSPSLGSTAQAAAAELPVATPAQLEAYAHAMQQYQMQLQQYHATCAAIQQQYYYQQQQQQQQLRYMMAPPQATHAPTRSISGPLPAASSASSVSSSAPAAVGLTVPAHATTSSSPAPAGSILAALTSSTAAAAAPNKWQQQQQEEEEAQRRRQQLQQAHARAMEQLIRAYAEAAQQAAPQAQAAQAAAGGAGVRAPAPGVAGAAAPAPAAAAAAAPGRRAALARYVDARLLLKFIVLFVLFAQNGDWHRCILLGLASVMAYLYQVGAFRRGGPPDAHARARDGAVLAGGGGGGGGVAEEDDEMDMEFVAQQGGAMGAGAQIPPREQPAEVAPGAAAPQAGPRPDAAAAAAAAAGDVGALAMAAPAPLAVPQGVIACTEQLIVGLFASLMPSWQPVVVPAAAAVAPPQQQEEEAEQPAEPQAQAQREEAPPAPMAH